VDSQNWNTVLENLGEHSKTCIVSVACKFLNSSVDVLVKKYCQAADFLAKLSTGLKQDVSLDRVKIKVTMGDYMPLQSLFEKSKQTLGDILDDDIFFYVLSEEEFVSEQESAKITKKVLTTDDDGYKEMGDFKSVLINRYDEESTHRFIVDYKISMRELLSVLKEKLSIDEDSKWRMKFLFNNKWVFREEMIMNFYDHGWLETGTRILLEKGEIPSNGEFPIVISHHREVYVER
jgi:hypothetical protein